MPLGVSPFGRNAFTNQARNDKICYVILEVGVTAVVDDSVIERHDSKFHSCAHGTSRHLFDCTHRESWELERDGNQNKENRGKKRLTRWLATMCRNRVRGDRRRIAHMHFFSSFDLCFGLHIESLPSSHFKIIQIPEGSLWLPSTQRKSNPIATKNTDSGTLQTI